MTKNERERWEKFRKMGRARYIWLMGVLYWGVVTGVLTAVATTAMNGNWDRFPISLGLALVFFPIGGYFFGHFTWKAAEARYRSSLAKDEAEEEKW